MAHRKKHTKYDTLGATDNRPRKHAFAASCFIGDRTPARHRGIDTTCGKGTSSSRGWLIRSTMCWVSALGVSFGTILAAHAASADALTAKLPGDPLQITSLTTYASQLKHKWTKYSEDNKVGLRKTAYVDLANIIRVGNTAT